MVKTHAIALNPFDFSLPIIAALAFPWIKYPFVPGTDVAGTAVEVGKGMSRFKTGDRVVAMAWSFDKKSSGSPEGAFQSYVVVRETAYCPVPTTLSFADANVIPLASITAFSGLLGKDACALQFP